MGQLRHALLLHVAVASTTLGYVYPESLTHSGQPVDDMLSILQAFDICGTNGSVILTKNIPYIDQVINTTNLLNCDVSIYGEPTCSSGSLILTRSSMPICRPRGFCRDECDILRPWTGTIQWPWYIFPYTFLPHLPHRERKREP